MSLVNQNGDTTTRHFLHLRVKEAESDPLVSSMLKTNPKQAFDYFAYIDSLYYLGNSLKHEAPLYLYDETHPITHFDEEAIYLRNYPTFDVNVNAPEGVYYMTHNHIVHILPIDDYMTILRSLGEHHTLNSNKELFKGKKLTLVRPFEHLIYIDKNKVEGQYTAEEIKDLFFNDIHNEIFNNVFTPSACSMIVVDNNLNQCVGYVTHANALASQMLSQPEFEHYRHQENEFREAIKYDTVLALEHLKNRYLLDIDEACIERVKKLKANIKHQGHGISILDLNYA